MKIVKKEKEKQEGVCQSHCGLAIYMKKKVSKGKRGRITETQKIFHHAKIY
jgi:hypothetical protein